MSEETKRKSTRGAQESDISGEGQVAVENAWMEYNHNRLLSVRVGKQLSPQYWWQNHYPNLTLSTALPIYLRELFPAELVGVMVQGSAARPVGTSELGVGYKFYVANNNFEGNSRATCATARRGARAASCDFPTGGALRRFDVAADIYRGHVGLTTNELAEDNVFGFESQLELSSFLFQAEWARGKSLEQTRTGYYLQPALRIDEDWIAFYRLEQLESPRIRRAERRHIGGLNYRPYPQIAFKGELYRSQPLEREFIHSTKSGSRSTGWRRRRCSSSDLRDTSNPRGGADRSAVDGQRVHPDRAVRRHREQGEPGEDAHGRRAAAHLHEAVAHVAARRADGAGGLGQHALSAAGVFEAGAEPIGARDGGVLGAAVDDAGHHAALDAAIGASGAAVRRERAGRDLLRAAGEVDDTVTVVKVSGLKWQ